MTPTPRSSGKPRNECEPGHVASEADLLAALEAFALHARGVTRPLDSAGVWLGDVAQARVLLRMLAEDPAVAAGLEMDGPMLTMPWWGITYDPSMWLAGFLRVTRDPEIDVAQEARRFLRGVRVADGAISARARTSIFGVAVEAAVGLPFGLLRPAERREVPDSMSEWPPAAVFESDVEVPAVIAGTSYPWSPERQEELIADLRDRIDESLGRMIVTLALTVGGPIQEYVTTLTPRYVDSTVGRDPQPLGPFWALRDPEDHHDVDVDRLRRGATAVTRVSDCRRLAVAARRYFQAGAERTKPADQIVDYAVAIEAITGQWRGRAQADELAALLGDGIREPFKDLKDARNSILHHGVIPANITRIVGTSRMLVDHAITSAVRERQT